MTRNKKYRLAFTVIGNLYANIKHTENGRFAKWAYVPKDKDMGVVLREMERKKLIVIKDTKGGWMISLKTFCELKHDKSYFYLNGVNIDDLTHKISKEFTDKMKIYREIKN